MPEAVIWTNAGILLTGPLGTNFRIYTVSFKKMHLKILSGKWGPFCLGLNVLNCHLNFVHWICFYDDVQKIYQLNAGLAVAILNIHLRNSLVRIQASHWFDKNIKSNWKKFSYAYSQPVIIIACYRKCVIIQIHWHGMVFCLLHDSIMTCSSIKKCICAWHVFQPVCAGWWFDFILPQFSFHTGNTE